jgi:Tfp pilus assembly protein FimT
MKIRRMHQLGGEGGFSLIECLVYIGLFAAVVGFATMIFYQSWDDSKALRRNADDIVRVLHAGDQWRTDVRAAVGPMKLTSAAGAEQLHIPASSGETVYTFSDGEIHRQAAGDAVNRVWLSNIKSSQMQADLREGVAAWRWELELKTAKRTARFRPLFTFETVAGGGITR